MSVRVSGQDNLIRATLRKTLLFAKWTDAELDPLCKASELWRYSKDEAIALRADPAKGMWIVTSGAVVNNRTWPNGNHMISGIFFSGMTFGVLSALDGEPMPYNAHATVETLAVFIPRAVLLEHVRNKQADVINFICHLSRIDAESLQMRASASLRCQLAKFIAYMSRGALLSATSPLSAEYAPATVEITQNVLAAMLFVSRQTINGLMISLARDGVIVREKGSIRVVDFARLLELMEEVEPLPDNWRTEILDWQRRPPVAAAKAQTRRSKKRLKSAF